MVMRTRRKSTVGFILLVSLLSIVYCNGVPASYPMNDGPYRPGDYYNARWQEDLPDERRNRPPPPPPSQQSASAFTARTPIHYNFRSKATEPEDLFEKDGNVRALDEYSESREGKIPKYASARRDPVTLFQSTLRGRMLLFVSALSTGALLSAFFLHGWWHPGALAFTIGYLVRGAFGDCVRSLALAMLWTMHRSRRVWKVYPTWRHIKACIRAGPRRPYPPASNPWNYQPSSNAPSFNMMYTLISIAIVGSTVGGNVPLVPKWLGGLLGAGFFAYLATQSSALGDLVRTAGMRVVGLLQELWQVAMELRLRQQLTVLAVRLFDRLMFLDRQHRIRDRVTAGVTLFYQQVILRAMNQQNNSSSEDDEPRRDRPRRRRPVDGDDMDRFDRGSASYKERFSLERKGERWQDSDRGIERARRDDRRLGKDDALPNDRERDWQGQQRRRTTINHPDRQRSNSGRKGPNFQERQAEDESIY